MKRANRLWLGCLQNPKLRGSTEMQTTIKSRLECYRNFRVSGREKKITQTASYCLACFYCHVCTEHHQTQVATAQEKVLAGGNQGLSSWLAYENILSLLLMIIVVILFFSFFLRGIVICKSCENEGSDVLGKGLSFEWRPNWLFIIAEFVQDYLNAMSCHKSPLCEGACLNVFTLILIRLLCLLLGCLSRWQGFFFLLTVSL